MGTDSFSLVDSAIAAVYVSQTSVESTIASNFHAIYYKNSKSTQTENDNLFIHH